MKTSLPFAVATRVLLATLLTVSLASVSAAVTLAMGSSPQIPAAEGQVKVNHTQNANVEIELKVKHLAPPGRVSPGASVFVVWSRGLAPGAESQNLGALMVDKKLNAKLRTVTAMQSFDLFLTCEQSATALVPSTPELMPVHYLSK